MMLHGLAAALDRRCSPGQAPPLETVGLSLTRLTGPQGMTLSSTPSVECAVGSLACGVVIIRLGQAFYGKPTVIRDIRLRCCDPDSGVVITEPLFNKTKPYVPPVYDEFTLPVDFDVALFAASLEGLRMDSWPTQVDGPTVYGTISFITSPSQACSAFGDGYRVAGLYGEPGYTGGGELTFVNTLYAICSVRCTTCPAGYYCLGGNTTAAPCPVNSFSAPGTRIEAACACNQGFVRRGSICYCPPNTYLPAPHSTACAACPEASVCAGDNLAVPCAQNAIVVSTGPGTPGVCACAPGYYQAANDSALVCIECPGGYFCAGNGTLARCWDHSTSGNGSATCRCLPGYTGSDGACRICPAGSFCPTGLAGLCPPGTYAAAPGTTACTVCPTNSGTQAPGATSSSQCVCAPGFTGVPGAGLCYACPPGGYCPGFGIIMLPCGPGTYQTGYGFNSSGDCTLCGQGTYSTGEGALSPDTCTGCAAGSYQTGLGGTSAGSACRPCGPGSYGALQGQSACDLCPEGTVLSSTGASSPSACTGCVAGSYQTGRGMTSVSACTPCPAGTFQTALGMGNVSGCLLCRPGTFQPDRGQPFEQGCQLCAAGTVQPLRGGTRRDQCVPCAPGSYQPIPGSEAQACPLCPAGTYQTGRGIGPASACVSCPPGAFQPVQGANASAACAPCPAGTYQPDPASSACVACAAGTYLNRTGVNSSLACIACPPGTYQPVLAARHASGCIVCRTGTFQSAAGATSLSACRPCPAGTFQPVLGAGRGDQCVACAAGRYQTGLGAGASRDCTPCPAGTFQPATGAISNASCAPCAPGTYQPILGAGSVALCTACPPGTYQTGEGVTTLTACIPCGRGVFASGSGLSSPSGCLPCPAGTFHDPGNASSQGASTCTKCVPGSFQAALGQTHCVLCPPGTFQPIMGAAFDWWCAPCDQGTYSTATGAGTFSSCAACTPGTFAPDKGLTACTACDRGKYARDPGTPMCFSCMSGTYANATAASTCARCLPGESANGTGLTACAACAPGRFQYLGGASACFACPPGHVQPFPGATHCDACAPGLFQANGSGIACAACPAGGYAAEAGATGCVPCAPGAIQNGTGQTACVACPMGAVQNRTGQTECEPCASGGFQARTGAIACLPCGRGEFQPDTGASACLRCRPGSFHAGLGLRSQDDCLNCTAGFYSAAAGATRCAACGPGLFAPEGALSACAECPPGSFQNATNASSCLACPPGTAGTGWARSSQRLGCAPCPAGRFTNTSGATGCEACPSGTLSNRTGGTGCAPCGPGTFMDSQAWGQAACPPCPAGTYSAATGATTRDTCTLCPDGFFSARQGQISPASCGLCQLGTISVGNKSLCARCGRRQFCPPGYPMAIPCQEPGLECNGTHLAAAPGYLPILRGNCSGAIPCPRGTACAATGGTRPSLLPPLTNATAQFIVFEGGPNRTWLLCPSASGRSVRYGVSRLDWPYAVEALPSPVLFWLGPAECPPGSFLLDDACAPCPAGTFSTLRGALSSAAACRPCPPGAFGTYPGATTCGLCPPGAFQNLSGQTDCVPCDQGAYRSSQGGTACALCAPGTFAELPGTAACTACEAGSHQPVAGLTACLPCGADEFSSAGDAVCHPCGANIATTLTDPTCPPPVLPSNRAVSVWVDVRGPAGARDDCFPTTATGGAGPLQVSRGYVIFKPGGVECESTLHIAGRPSLSRSWTSTVAHPHRPVSLRVIPFNDTFYPDRCHSEGFGVLFTVADAYGSLYTDLSGGARAIMSILAPADEGEALLFSISCARLPQSTANVPLGVCRTTFCPTMAVMVRVTLSWPGGSVQGSVHLGTGPISACPPTTSWMAAVELLDANVPYFPGDTLAVQISNLNPPVGAGGLVVFDVALRLLGGVTFLSFDSAYSVVSRLDPGGVLSVVGDASLGTQGTVLGVLRLRLNVRVSGVVLAVRAVGVKFTLANAVPYQMLVRTRGFSCRADGFVDVLADHPRAYALVTSVRRASVVNWRRIHPAGAPNLPATVHVVAVGVAMHAFGPVRAACTSLDPRSLFVASCTEIRATNWAQGNASAAVRVEYLGAIARVLVAAWVPSTAVFQLSAAPNGMSGRYRFVADLSAAPYRLRSIDATGFIPDLLGLGVMLDPASGQWRCTRAGLPFTIGLPVFYSGVCGNASTETRGSTWFLVSDASVGVVMSIGEYTFPPAALSGAAPNGGLLLFSDSGHLLPISPAAVRLFAAHQPQHSVSVVVTTAELESEPILALRSAGGSARCTGLALGNFTGYIPVFPAAPSALQIVLSAYTLVRQTDPTLLIPTSTFVIRASLLFSDGTRLGIQADPRLSMSSPHLLVSGLAATTDDTFVGDATLHFRFQGAPCVATALQVRVLASSVRTAALVCLTCPRFLAAATDPLSQQLPWTYPSAIQASSVFLRRHLYDGRVVDTPQPIAVAGTGDGPLALINGWLVGRSEGNATLVSAAAAGNATSEVGVTPLTLAVIDRWVVTSALLCNGIACSDPSLRFAPPGDGAAAAPFAYASQLTLSLALGLRDGSTARLAWLRGVVALVNGTEVPTVQGTVRVPLAYGMLHVQSVFADEWRLPPPEVHDGALLRVDRLSTLRLEGPSILHQIHCSGVWEQARFDATGTLTDGTTSAVVPLFSTTPPVAPSATEGGLFHAVSAGQGSITARFGGMEAQLFVECTVSSLYFTAVVLDFIPSPWSAPRGTRLADAPQLQPALVPADTGAWFDREAFLRTILRWTSSAPQVVSASGDGLVLLQDHYEPVQITASLVQCDAFQGLDTTRTVTVDVIPTQTGDVDFDRGFPVAVGDAMSLPIYVFAAARLQAYMVEVEIPGIDPTDCTPGVLPGSQCQVLAASPAALFRSVGAFAQGQLTGRLLVATVRGRVLLNSVATARVTVLQLVVGDAQLVAGPLPPQAFLLRLGTGPLPSARRAAPGPPRMTMRRALSTPLGLPLEGVYGDTDGDGLFTPLDVLFAEAFVTATVSGAGAVCTGQRCQPMEQLTAWQLQQLKPIRAPGAPATVPDGGDILFLMRALAGKAMFLRSVDVNSRAGSLQIAVGLVDFLQNPAPTNVIVRLEFVTVANRFLPFDAPTRSFNEATSVLTIQCLRHPGTGVFAARSLTAGAITVEEPSVGLRVRVQTLDALGSADSALALDRSFLFLPTGPVRSFHIIGGVNSPQEITTDLDTLPVTPACQTLCEVSLFLDGSIGEPEWLNSSALAGRFMSSFLRHGFFTRDLFVVASVSPWLPPPGLPTQAIPVPTPVAGAGSQVGTRVNVTHGLPAGVDLGILRVELPAAGLALVGIHGASAEVIAGSAPPLLLVGSRAPFALELRVIAQGSHALRLRALQLQPSAPLTAAVFTVTGVQPSPKVLVGLEATPQCTAGAILWSKLLTGLADEPCVVHVAPVWQLGGRGAPEPFRCTGYPCVLQAFGQTLRPDIPTLVPSQPAILVQSPVLTLGQRTQWRVVCSFPGTTGPVAVTERALAAGLVRATPANALAITRDSIRGARAGRAVVTFAGLIRVGLNVSSSDQPVIVDLSGFAYTGVGLQPTATDDDSLAAVFQRPQSLLAGTRYHLFLRVAFQGGYALRLDPVPGAEPGLSLRNISADAVLSHADGTLFVRTHTLGGPDVALLEVTYHGTVFILRARVVPWIPTRLELPGMPPVIRLASRSSVMFGVLPSSFELPEPPRVFFEERAAPLVLSAREEDPSLHSVFDPAVLVYHFALGSWSLTPAAPPSGSTVVTLRYVHPASLAAVEVNLTVVIIDAVALELPPSASAPLRLRRVHCAPSAFESATLHPALRLTDGVRLALDASSAANLTLVLDSSHPAVAAVSRHPAVVQGLSVGQAVIRATLAPLPEVTLSVVVVDESVLVRNLSLPPRYVLRGPEGALFPVQDRNNDVGMDLTLLQATVELLDSDGSVALRSARPTLVLLGNPPLLPTASRPRLRVTLPECGGTAPLVVVSSIDARLVADASHTADVELEWGADFADVVLVSPLPVHGFDVRLRHRSEPKPAFACTPLADLPVLSDCAVIDESTIAIVGVAARQMPGPRARLVRLVGVGGGVVWGGTVEVFDGTESHRQPIRAGRFGPQPPMEEASDQGIAVVDVATIHRRLFRLQLREAFFGLQLLMDRQREADCRIYSNEFELSASIRLTDRFMHPDTNRSSVRILFHSDRLPAAPGATLVRGEGLWMPARHVLDGWYVAELRQKIPELRALHTSFTVQTTTSGPTPWLWTVAEPIDTGVAVPPCPRSATQTASFLAVYRFHLLDPDAPVTDASLLRTVVCGVGVAARRVSIQRDQAKGITLSVALESLARVHQANLALTGASRVLGRYNLSAVERVSLVYINDTRDPPAPCPTGTFFAAENGTYMPLPPHAVAGPDCYGALCVSGYVMVPETGRCVPTPVGTDVIWICVVVVLTSILCLTALLCCVQLALLWQRREAAKQHEEVSMKPPDEPQPPPPPSARGEDEDATSVFTFDDPEERESYFRNVVTAVILDDYSAMLLEGEFSPTAGCESR